MKKLIYISIASILFCLNTDLSQAQSNQLTPNTSIVGSWAADSVFNVNFKTGKRKPDMDYDWFEFNFNPDRTGDESWNAGDDGGDINLTWSYSATDSVLKVILDKSKPTFWKFTHITDSTIDMISYEPGKHLTSGIERKFVNNYIILGKLVLSQNSSPITFPNTIHKTATLEYKTISETFPVTNETLYINLYDIDGKLVKTFMNKEKVYSDNLQKKQLDFSAVSPGYYTLTVADAHGKSESMKIAKK